MTHDNDMTGRLLELVTAARGALTPATVEQTPTDELRVLDGALDEIERLARRHRNGGADGAAGAGYADEHALAEYVHNVWPTAVAVYAAGDGDPTWVVDGNDRILAIVADLKESLAAPLRELISQMSPEQLARHRSTRAFAFKIVLAAVGADAEMPAGDADGLGSST